MSLTRGLIPFLVVLCAVLLAVLSSRVTNDLARRRSTVALITSLALVTAVAVGHHVAGWINEPIPVGYYLALLLPVFGTCLAGAYAIPRRVFGRRHKQSTDPWLGRVVAFVGALLLVPVGLSVVALRVNATYDYYPTVDSLGGGLGHNVSGLAELQRRTADRGSGPTSSHDALLSVAIPGSLSQFRARRAFLWLPPAFFTSQHPDLPVLLLLHGVPGQPSDWVRAGGLVRTANAFTVAHHGRGPIVVMPDVNGSLLGDSECVNSPQGNVETYLTHDVPAFMNRTFGDALSAKWAVAGLSEGGTCAAMLALRHPSLFDVFGDFSGLVGPTVGTTMNPPATITQLFGGSQASYHEHSPLWLLAHRPPHDMRAVFATGDQDSGALLALRELAGQARRAHLRTTTLVLLGGAQLVPLENHVAADLRGPGPVDRLDHKRSRYAAHPPDGRPAALNAA